MLIKRLKRFFSGAGDPPEMLSCEDALARLQEFVDGELPELSAEQVAAHFEVCTRCYPHLALETAFRERVRAALNEPDVPDDLRGRVMGLLVDDPGA